MSNLRSIPVHTTGQSAPLGHMAILGNYPPRRCGIATFTHDNYLALKQARPDMQVDLYAMDDGAVDAYPEEVTTTLADGDLAAYRRLADQINDSGAEVLWVQHEFGIFGGAAGGYLLALLERLTIPYAVMLHTVLAEPNADQRRVFEQILAGASAIVVMAEKGREILAQTYGVAADRVSLIPHGVPDQPFSPTAPAKAELGFADDKLILSFGLLSPDKGLEEMIEAMPAIVATCPTARYLILGQTHPHLLKREGEAYREALAAKAEALGVADRVSFINRFTSLEDLTQYLAAADVYVTPYRGAQQITSGTLSYAIGLGKPVVSTPYVHAREILADDHGVLVPFRDSAALSDAVAGLLTDDAAREELAERAYARGRTMIWPRFAGALVGVLAGRKPAVTARINAARPDAVEAKLGPIERLTDAVGMLQHSVFAVPDRDHGYCIDDNARALMLMSVAPDIPTERRLALSRSYAAFIQHAWNEEEGCYRNFMGYDRRWLETCGSEDSNGRTLWALGVTAARHPDALLRRWATQQFDRTAGRLSELNSPRTIAFSMLGAIAMLEAHPGHARSLVLLQNGGGRLMSLLFSARRPGWYWFESRLAYDNARLCEALIRAGEVLGMAGFTRTGLETLEWLKGVHSPAEGHFRPVGSLSFGSDYANPHAFDQQPLEAWAVIDACEAAWRASANRVWIDHAESAHAWFLGANDLGQALVSPETGDCHDGLTPVGVNLNTGAESVLSWQFAVRAWSRLTASAGVETRTAAG